MAVATAAVTPKRLCRGASASAGMIAEQLRFVTMNPPGANPRVARPTSSGIRSFPCARRTKLNFIPELDFLFGNESMAERGGVFGR